MVACRVGVAQSRIHTNHIARQQTWFVDELQHEFADLCARHESSFVHDTERIGLTEGSTRTAKRFRAKDGQGIASQSRAAA